MRMALIPARGGSKGIKDKNLQLVGDMNLVERAISETQESNLFDRICLSTDSQRIAEVGHLAGVEVLDRKASLSTDGALISDVILDHIRGLGLVAEDDIWMIQPTALFRSKADFGRVDQAMSGIAPLDRYGFTVRRVEDSHPARMYRREKNEWTAVIPDQQHFRRQDLEPLFLRDGLFYFSSVAASLRHDGTFFGSEPVCVDLEKDYYANIDGVEDLAYARFLLAENMV